MRFSKLKGFIFDMDGVLWRGNVPLPGMHELFRWLDESGVPYALATNNSSKTAQDYVQKLASLDVQTVPPQRILTSGLATAAYLQTRYPAGTRVYVFGMDGLRKTLAEAGFAVVDGVTDTAASDVAAPNAGAGTVDAVVVGVHFEMTYAALKQAALYVRAGAAFIGTNPDKTFPMPEGLVPGAGSMIAAVQAATDVEPIIIGKPNAPMFEAALRLLGTTPQETVMVGDRLNTDILGARDAGLNTILLFTGVTTPEDLSDPTNGIWPDVAYEGLPELLKAWAGDDWYLAQMKRKKGRA